MNTTLGDLIRKEAKERNLLYCNKPYSCGIDEASGQFDDYSVPSDKRMTIVREEKSVTISISPLKGSGKRKPYVIELWR